MAVIEDEVTNGQHDQHSLVSQPPKFREMNSSLNQDTPLFTNSMMTLWPFVRGIHCSLVEPPHIRLLVGIFKASFALPKQAAEQMVKLPVIGDALTLICDITVMLRLCL